MRNKTLSPLYLRSRIGPFTNIGDVASVTPLDIVNPNRSAMLIDQIRFSLAQDADVDFDFVMLNNIITGLLVEILLGSIAVTKRHVTLGALCPRYLSSDPTTVSDEPIVNENPEGDGCAVWHLPVPLYVPSNVQLSINMMRRACRPNDNTSPIPEIDVAIVGRSLPSDFPVPGEIDVPFVSEFRTENDTDLRVVSADSDLANTENVPLYIKQLVAVNNAEPDEESDGPTRDANFTVQMSLSNGTLLIRDPVPFFVVFPADRGILPLNAKLQPGEFIRCELEAGNPDADQYSRGVATTAVAMHGYRKVQTPGTIG